MSRNRNKERLVAGHCDLGGRRIYFYGKISAVSDCQAHYFVCCDIRQRFEYEQFVNPELTICRTFTSSDYILRQVSPAGIVYFEDKDMKHVIRFQKPKVIQPIGGEGYGEDGEEIVDF